MLLPFIFVEGVSRRYGPPERPVWALRELSVDIEAGAFAAVVGRSGSGKSTLLHLLAAMDRPTAGRVVVGGREVSALSRAEEAAYRRETVGMLFQGFHLVPTLTAQRNVELPLVLAGADRRARERRAAGLLERVGLGPRAGHRPGELSGGEQQRVALARALAHDPPLLLADEPTGNLDTQTAAAIVELLAAFRAEGRTVVVVTHTPAEFAAAADRVIRLEDGAVVPTAAAA